MGVAVATAAVLVGGSTLANALLPGQQPMRADDEVLVGETSGNRTSLLLAGNGWVRDLDAKKFAGDAQSFVRGPLEVQVAAVDLTTGTTADADRLWEGMGNTLRVADPDVRLDDPAPITSDQGVDGLTGAIQGGRSEAVAVLYPAPNGQVATQMVLRAREDTADLGEDAGAVSRSVIFSGQKESA